MREAQKAYAFPGGCADAVKGVERERERERERARRRLIIGLHFMAMNESNLRGEKMKRR